MLVSVFTPAYKTGHRIARPLLSLLAQTHRKWEWVVVDDSDDKGETFSLLAGLAKTDARIRVVKAIHSGNIGAVKRMACKLCEGAALVELDHDDELAPDALAVIVAAFNAHPSVGFLYSDFSEPTEPAPGVQYPDGWGWGYGQYKDAPPGAAELAEEAIRVLRAAAPVCRAPNVNPKTVRHINAMPNHVRCWRTSAYWQAGGHDPQIPVADDYEVMLRTFLTTRMGHVPRCLYYQWRNASGNTHQARLAEIQKRVEQYSRDYDPQIHARLVDLGVNDYLYSPGKTFDRLMQGACPNPPVEQHVTIEVAP